MRNFAPSYEVHISPTPKDGEVNALRNGRDYWSAHGFGLKSIIATAGHADDSRLIFPTQLDDGKLHDFTLGPPKPATVVVRKK